MSEEADELAESSEADSSVGNSGAEGLTKVSLANGVRMREYLFVTIRKVKKGIAARLFTALESGSGGKFVQLRTQKYTVESLRNEIASNKDKPVDQVHLGRWVSEEVVVDLEPGTNLGTLDRGFIVVGIAV